MPDCGIMSRMDIRILRYFIAVAEEGNITKAAARLHVSQPALSTQLAALEDELGQRLFERGARGIELTEKGLVLKRRADGTTVDLTQAFLEQYKNYPIVRHDDFIDCLADIKDDEIVASMRPPKGEGPAEGRTKASMERRIGFR